jgi:hypothetical protein
MLSYLDYTEDFPVLGSYSPFSCSVAVYLREHRSVFYVVCTYVSGRICFSMVIS